MGVKTSGITAIDCTTEQLQLLLTLLNKYLPGVETWAYGSRVTAQARPSSDLDLVVFSGPADTRKLNDLQEALAESNLPFRVDIFAWYELPDSFQTEIAARHLVLVPADS